MARAATLEPESFINPSLPVLLTWPVVWAQAHAADAGLLRGRAADPLLAGRVLSALAGAGAVFLIGLAAERVRRGLGVLSASLLALSPGVVNLCHFATPEPWLILGAALTLLVALDHLQGRRGVLALGLALGITAGTKYTAAALLAPCLAALWLRPRTDPSRRRDHVVAAVAGAILLLVGLALALGPGDRLAASLHLADVRLLRTESARAFTITIAVLLMAGGAALLLAAAAAQRGMAVAQRVARADLVVLLIVAGLAFLLTTPYAAIQARSFLSDLAFNQQTRHEYKGLVGASTSFGPYLALLAGAMTGPLAFAAVAGVLVGLGRALKGERAMVVVVAAAVAPYVLVATSGHQAMRFLAPVWPAAVILAALALRTLLPPRVRAPVTGLVIARAAIGAVLVLRLFFVDSRYAAGRWLDTHVPAAQAIDVITNNPGYGPALEPGRARIVPTLSREMAPAERFAAAAAAYRGEGAPWLVLTASYYERFLDHPDQAPERAAFFRDLLEGRGGYEVAGRFRQTGWQRPAAEFLDPEIVVLRKTEEPAAHIPTR
jgi:hypothetical protein